VQDSQPSRQKKVLSLRLAPQLHVEVAEVAREAGVPLAAAARALLGYALARWRGGDVEVHRAVRASRDG